MSDNNLMKIVGVAVAAMVVIGLLIFLFNSDGGASGARILGQEGGSFWFSAIFFAILAVIAIVVGIGSYKKKGNAATTIISLIAAAVFIAIAFGKGCTDKANGGVTTEKGRVESFPH